jgi:hypothetical protein
LEIIAAPKVAAKYLTTMSVVKDFAKPHGITRRPQMDRQTRYTGRRPYNSLRGANTRQPVARPNRYVVKPRVVTVYEDPNSSLKPDEDDV